jgi:predicted RNA-binding protein with PIN domain
MALLIDGYNLLHVSDIFAGEGAGTELHRSRMALLEFLAKSIDPRERNQTTIVFDAAGAPPGLRRSMTHEGMNIHFARRHSDADEMIEELLEQYAAPRELVVVSSDHRVQRAARRCGAVFIDSEQWYAKLRAARMNRLENDKTSADLDDKATPDEIAYWIDEFADAPPDESPANPFPPGYADDVTEE